MAQRILLIDDDELVLLSLEDLLTAEGFAVDTASQGAAGLAKAQATRYDLVVLDVIMPGMSGFEVCRALRALPDYAGVPVIMLTAKSGEADRAQGLAMGASHFLPKPTDPFRLLNLIQEALRTLPA